MGRIHRPTFAGPKDVTGNSYGLIFSSYDGLREGINEYKIFPNKTQICAAIYDR